MISQDTSVRDIVPYVPPKKSCFAIVGQMFARTSKVLYAFFEVRKKYYLSFLLLFSFGVLIGTYVSSLHTVVMSLLNIVLYCRALLFVSLLCGVTVFGVAVTPCCCFLSAFLCGMLSWTSFYEKTSGFLLLCLFYLFLMFFCLFFAESFCASKRSLRGCKVTFCCKSFIAFITLFFASLLFCILLLYCIPFLV